MAGQQILAAILLLGLLAIAVASDLRRHRIPNVLILAGLFLAFSLQAYSHGLAGMGEAAIGLLIGFVIFLPLYAMGGMAAGDVKLMAMAGSFLTPNHAIWMVFFSLMAGSVCGLVIILMRGQLVLTLSRYWLMLATRSHIAPAADEVAAKPFPYSLAIFLGVLAALVWRPFDPWQVLQYTFG